MIMANSDVIGGYLEGQKSFLAEEERQKRSAREEATALKQKNIQAEQQKLAQRASAQGYLKPTAYTGLGALDPQAAKQAQDVYSPLFEQHQEKLKNGWIAAQNLPPGPQRQERVQTLIKTAHALGTTDEQTANDLSFGYRDDPEGTTPVINQIFGMEPKREKITGDYKTYQYKDDPSRTIVLNEADPRDQEMLRRERGNLIPAPARQERAEAGGFGISKAEAEKRRNRETGVRVAVATANDLMDRIDQNPDLLQTAAGVAQALSGLGSEIRSAARVAGVEIPENVQNIAAYEDTFSELGIDNLQAKGLAFDLALSYASASGLGSGRELSEKDIKNALRRVAETGLNTPAARRANIQDLARIMDRNFRIDYKVRTGTEFEGDLGLRQPRQAPQEQQVEEGKLVRQGGVTYKFINGEWVQQ